MANKPIPVLFRTYRGELTAYFPTLSWSYRGDITCYAHVGQHGGACKTWLQRGKPAEPAEYADLLAELRGIYASERDQENERFDLVPMKRQPSRRSVDRWHWELSA